MENIAIKKVAILKDGRLAVYPEIKSNSYQYIYREACAVYWENELGCFHSPIPKEWSYKQWYGQILSVVRSGLGINLDITSQTEYEPTEEKFKSDIITENTSTQKWMSEHYK